MPAKIAAFLRASAVGQAASAASRRARASLGRNAFASGSRLFEKGAVFLASARAQLSAYEPSASRERVFRERMLALLDSSAPTSRRQFEPGHLTASAFVLSPESDAILLILHKKLRIWVQPGGHIEPGDASLEAAARREVSEEVGLALVDGASSSVFDLDVHAIAARKDEPSHEHFDVRFCFRASSRVFVASDEVADVAWVELSKIDVLTSDESVLRAARKLSGAR